MLLGAWVASRVGGDLGRSPKANRPLSLLVIGFSDFLLACWLFDLATTCNHILVEVPKGDHLSFPGPLST